MNKKGFLVFCLVFSLVCTVSVYAASLEFDGAEIGKDSPPIITKDKTLVPMRALLEKVGMEIKWDETTKTATAQDATTSVEITIGSTNGKLKGQAVKLDSKPIIQNSRTMIPLSLAKQVLGLKTFFNGDNKNIGVFTSQYLEKVDQLRLTYILARCLSPAVTTEQGVLRMLVGVSTQNNTDPELKFDFNVTNTIDMAQVQKVLSDSSISDEKKQEFLDSIKAYITAQAAFVAEITQDKSKLEGSVVLKDGENQLNKILSWANYDQPARLMAMVSGGLPNLTIRLIDI